MVAFLTALLLILIGVTIGMMLMNSARVYILFAALAIGFVTFTAQTGGEGVRELRYFGYQCLPHAFDIDEKYPMLAVFAVFLSIGTVLGILLNNNKK